MKSWRDELSERLDRQCDPHTEVKAGLGVDITPCPFWKSHADRLTDEDLLDRMASMLNAPNPLLAEILERKK